MALRPNLRISQEFRAVSPAAPVSVNPLVLIGVHRHLEYRATAGTYTGGLDNGDYSFPDLVEGSAVENTTHAETELRPKVYISNEFGVAEVTDDVTFSDMDNVGTLPNFAISDTAAATFVVSSGTTGAFESTSGGDAGAFTDINADFIEDSVAVGDTITVGARDGFTVTAVVSDGEVTVTRANSGPTDSLVTLSAKDANDVRTLTYTGSTYQGFSTAGVARGDLVNFDGWSPRNNAGVLTYTAQATDGTRIVTAIAKMTNVSVGDIIFLSGADSRFAPFFIIVALGGLLGVADDDLTVVRDLTDSGLAAADVVNGTDRLAKTFEVKTSGGFKADAGLDLFETGYFSASVSGVRTFTDTTTTLTTTFANADVMAVHAARSLSSDDVDIVSGDFARTTGSFIADGYVPGMNILIHASDTPADIGEHVLATVTATAMTVVTPLAGDSVAGGLVVTSSDVSIPFKILGAPVLADAMPVVDYGVSRIPAAESGGAIRYSVYTATNVALAFTGTSSVTAEVGGIRDVIWPVPFIAGATLPLAGDYVYNDDGTLLFSVVDAVFHTADTSLVFDETASVYSLTVGGGDLTTDFGIGDVINVPDAAINTGQYTIASLTATVLTLTEVVADETLGALVIQKFEVSDHANAGFDVAATDIIVDVGLEVRQPDTAPYSVIRVLDDTTMQLTHVLTGDEVTDVIVYGLDTRVTLPNSAANITYSVDKDLTGTALIGSVLTTYAGRRRDSLGDLLEVTLGTISDYGPAVPGNPMGLAASNAVNNTAVVVKAIQVGDDTTAGWAAALDVATTPDVYILAPLTQDETILGTFQSHTVAQSSADNKRERILYQSHVTDSVTVRWVGDISDTVDLVVTSSTQVITVTTTDNLVNLGAVPGDYVEGTFSGYFSSSGFATGTYRSRITAIVDNGSSFTLTMLPVTLDPTVAAGVRLSPVQVESKPLSTTQLRDAIAAYPSSIADRRIRNLYPFSELVTFDDETNPNDTSEGFYGGGSVTDYEVGGWLMCARVGALRSGVNPSTPMAKRSLNGTQRLVTPFSNDIAAQDVILDGGNYLMVQPNGDSTNVSAVRGVTTDVSTLFFLEEQVTVQVDNFARLLRAQITPILGSNVLDETFFDLYSMTQAGVINQTVMIDKSLKSARLIEIKEDPARADTFLASYNVGVFVSAANGDIVIFI